MKIKNTLAHRVLQRRIILSLNEINEDITICFYDFRKYFQLREIRINVPRRSRMQINIL